MLILGRDRVRELLVDEISSQLDVEHFVSKIEDQKYLVRSGDDVSSLKTAMKAFTSLQHVQILRLQDQKDRALLDFIDENDDTAQELVHLDWKPACIHAVRTMGDALLQSQSPFNRFSGPMMNPQSALMLKSSPAGPEISSLAERLTCLELHFDAGVGLDRQMQELSGLFRTVFTAAKNMQAVHVGFPSRLPLELRLEEIFHDVRWEKLRAFGIQAWRLDADEIINLARRHRKTLRGLRLRDVLLKEGSRWKDVLSMLHDEMESLDWVSLRRIDYSKHFNEMWARSVEITDNQLFPNSDSDDDDTFGAHLSDADMDLESSGYNDSDEESDQDGDHGPNANELALSPDTPASAPWSSSSRGSYLAKSADELGDNGVDVLYERRKVWEQWVVSRPRMP